MVAPFGATVDDVAALLPEASIPETRAAGQRAVVVADVEAWLTQYSAEADLALAGWGGLPTEQQDRVTEVARGLVAAAAASVTEAARAPERAGLADTSYAQVLWARWVSGLAALRATVTEWLAEAPETVRSRPAGSFPPATITDSVRW